VHIAEARLRPAVRRDHALCLLAHRNEVLRVCDEVVQRVGQGLHTHPRVRITVQPTKQGRTIDEVCIAAALMTRYRCARPSLVRPSPGAATSSIHEIKSFCGSIILIEDLSKYYIGTPTYRLIRPVPPVLVVLLKPLVNYGPEVLECVPKGALARGDEGRKDSVGVIYLMSRQV
jgi:hypothetical protein